ncbi:MAG: hypothetical protein AABW92_03305 [Nanoarchaeota archaeon]
MIKLLIVDYNHIPLEEYRLMAATVDMGVFTRPFREKGYGLPKEQVTLQLEAIQFEKGDSKSDLIHKVLEHESVDKILWLYNGDNPNPTFGDNDYTRALLSDHIRARTVVVTESDIVKRHCRLNNVNAFEGSLENYLASKDLFYLVRDKVIPPA